MGRPKAFLRPGGGAPLVARAVAALRAAGLGPVVIGANDPAPFAGLGLPVVPDPEPGLGPLAGLAAVLDATAPAAWCLVVACDMPTLEPALLRDLAERAAASEREAVVPRAGGRAHPLHAVYARRCLPAVRTALAERRLGLTRLVTSLDVEWVDLPDGPSLRNVNRPADLEGLADDA